ncbi:E3 ubiquitin-protein ligase WAV3-like protein [Drosera capensis]
MSSQWRKAKRAFGLNLCYSVSRNVNEEDEKEKDSPAPANDSFSGAALLCRPGPGALSKSSTVPFQKTCSICLATMKPGDGHAIFTAECCHAFHFHCITSNVKDGNQACPVCRAEWKEVLIQGPRTDPASGKARNRKTVGWRPQHDTIMTVIRRLPSSRPNFYQNGMSPSEVTEPAQFDGDEPLNQQELMKLNASVSSDPPSEPIKIIDMRTYLETSPFPSTRSCDSFAVLIQLKAAVTNASKNSTLDHDDLPYISRTTRTPIDLVTVLDISGSMAGTKLALLKRAMGFVIQNLSSNDRLSVVAFSSTAQRLFPLQRMTESGGQQALQAVNSLVANGGTNIAEGLRIGAKEMEERREKNPVTSIILLSDGQDTYTVDRSGGNESELNHQSLLPSIMEGNDGSRFQIPVHTFGFGTDHDASFMHSISEASGGTFSYIETEAAIQDAFAQCIGGLLTVVVQQLQVDIECVHPAVGIRTMRSGSYPGRTTADGRTGYINVGDLYADEERDFLVHVNVPMEQSNNDTSLLKVRCMFKDPSTREMVTLKSVEVKVSRPVTVEQEVVSIEVDRQRNRLNAAEAMSQARFTAEHGDLAGAAAILENCRKMLKETVSVKCQDQLCVALDMELKEMQERLASRHVYESTGRAYILSGLSSHSWQRATSRGDSTDSSCIIHAYQTPSMIEMLTRSQASLMASPATQRHIHPALFFTSPNPR